MAEFIGPLTMVVCIKQVPLLSALRFDTETRRIVREGVPVEVNELDVYALSEAVHLRDRYGGEVVAITMGPPQAHDALANALAIGADRAIHLNDRTFGGADTLATARALALAIRQAVPEVDLIFCGRHSIDAETSQVGPEIAEMLNIPQVSAVQKIDIRFQNGRREIIATRETDDGSETLSVPLPVLVTAAERLNEGIWPDEQAIKEASQQTAHYQTITATDMGVEPHLLGQKGSPTWVAAVEPDAQARAGRIIAESDPERAVDLLLDDLHAHGLLPTSQSRQENLSPAPALLRRKGEPLPGKAVWVVAERDRDGIRRITLELLGKGSELAVQLESELAAVLIGRLDVEQHAAILGAYGAEKVYIASDPALRTYSTDGYTKIVAEAIHHFQPAIVLFGSTADGRDLAPRVAARLNLGLTGDCVDLGLDEQQRLTQYKPAFGGSILSSILSNTTPAMATVRPGMLQIAQPDYSRVPTITHLPTTGVANEIRTQVLEREYQETGVEKLESARIILGIGMGMGEPENYILVYRLAELLEAAIGTTRNVADQGWVPKQMQIGLTGRAVSPDLYIALGVRGAAEHVAGIRKAGYVASINKNKRAAIFRHSDVGVVGDVQVLLPTLIKKLEEMQKT